MQRRIGLVLLDYDQAPITQRCLRSVAAGNLRPDEIVLVQNGERPVDLESDPVLAGLGVHVLHPEGNVGAAAGRNLALDHLVESSDVERFVLLDNDTVVPPEFFELAGGRGFEEFEIVAPLVFDMDSDKVIYAGGNHDRNHIPEVIAAWPEGETEPREVDWAPTAALLFDRDSWLRVGGFDVWYEFLWEDAEWCYRAAALGARIRVEPQLRVMHQPHQSSGGPFSPERLRRWSRNGTVFMFETAQGGWRSKLSWFGIELRRVARELRAGWRPSAMGRLRGLAQGLREVMRRRRTRAAR